MKKRNTPIQLMLVELNELKELNPDQSSLMKMVIYIAENYLQLEKNEIIKVVNDGFEIAVGIKHGYNNAEEYYHHHYFPTKKKSDEEA